MEHRIRVAVPAPLFQPLDYLIGGHQVTVGCRVRVPLGRREVIGIVTSPVREVETDGLACREVLECLDAPPLLPPDLMWLCGWVAEYYQHPIGEVFATALPGPLREGRTRRGKPRGVSRQVPLATDRPTLSPEQSVALAGLAKNAGRFSVSLLEGVTGSGKTEIYLRLVEATLEAGAQALVLTPEIGLTPQLVERFEARFGALVATFHSGLTERARADAWMAAREQKARVLIGTRSAVFAPMPGLGLIVIDEEHDASFKQQEGLRYSARDLAVVRAKKAGVPLILGSATPSLESLQNLRSGRYQGFQLQSRAAQRPMPTVRLIDVRRRALVHGLSEELLEATACHLDAGGQVLIFVNRRGYAPTLLCHDCGWMVPCSQCDARMTLHRSRHRLICHHCGNQCRVPQRCETCGGASLIPVGEGTERLEQALQQRFEGQRIERVDSESMSRAGALEQVLADTRSGSVRILVGTQMLAKGHDLAGITLVGVVATDQALHSGDFRAMERLGQLLTQVSGRAGRGDRPGEVLVQTHQPEHPQLQLLLREGYRALAETLLEQRRTAELPPYSHLALLRADALDTALPMEFLRRVAATFEGGGIDLMGPVPAPMERRAGRMRAQLLLRSRNRQRLHAALRTRIPQIPSLSGARKLRWSVDVDPLDLF